MTNVRKAFTKWFNEQVDTLNFGTESVFEAGYEAALVDMDYECECSCHTPEHQEARDIIDEASTILSKYNHKELMSNAIKGKALRLSVELVVNAAAEWKYESPEELLEASQWVCRQLINSLQEYDKEQ